MDSLEGDEEDVELARMVGCAQVAFCDRVSEDFTLRVRRSMPANEPNRSDSCPIRLGILKTHLPLACASCSFELLSPSELECLSQARSTHAELTNLSESA